MKCTCTWIGKNEFCTQPSVDHRSYCEDHLWKIYQKGTHLSRRKKDIQVAMTVHFWEDLFNQAVEELESEGWSFEPEVDRVFD